MGGAASVRQPSYVLTLDGPEQPGLLHAITGLLVGHHADIRELNQFDDAAAHAYMARVEFAVPPEHDPGLPALTDAVEDFCEPWGLRAVLRRGADRVRVLVMVSKFEHCLNDLLFRARTGDLPIEIVAVVSNHPDHRDLAEWHHVPFFHLPVTPDRKEQAEAELLRIVADHKVDLVVLARYMQILSASLVTVMQGRVINIHHSFLPSFKGARPYHQAHARGVKTVGATAHYVTDDLDEGPIISQQVQEIDHTYTPEDLVVAGRDTECKALSNAVRWHCEGRVVIQERRTIVLR
ncbi:formyltetrahydrofolate deformylase [Allobranchiibius sp. CTAmp26]|uniref:formyltetrahydrofolate deformylase n=1 Tax=Allobranchiibius sp. CTAmp26 TaxID=2815214 RepID=UPI001FB68139|nr:formyltetrahydrofolate deformylase [Allobranchiibius sp. CTAmp26]